MLMVDGKEAVSRSDEEDELIFDHTSLLNKEILFRELSQKLSQNGCKLQVARTINLCFSFFGLGLCFAIPTATLEDLQRTTNSGLDIRHIYTARYTGYLFGSLLGGFLFDRYNRQFLLFLSLLATSIGVIVMPFCISVSSLMACTAITGITMGFLDTGGNVWCLDLWGQRSAPVMQTLHFCFGLGAFVAPLVAEPFLSPLYTNSSLPLSNGSLGYHNTSLKIPHMKFLHGNGPIKPLNRREVAFDDEEIDILRFGHYLAKRHSATYNSVENTTFSNDTVAQQNDTIEMPLNSTFSTSTVPVTTLTLGRVHKLKPQFADGNLIQVKDKWDRKSEKIQIVVPNSTTSTTVATSTVPLTTWVSSSTINVQSTLSSEKNAGNFTRSASGENITRLPYIHDNSNPTLNLSALNSSTTLFPLANITVEDDIQKSVITGVSDFNSSIKNNNSSHVPEAGVESLKNENVSLQSALSKNHGSNKFDSSIDNFTEEDNLILDIGFNLNDSYAQDVYNVTPDLVSQATSPGIPSTVVNSGDKTKDMELRTENASHINDIMKSTSLYPIGTNKANHSVTKPLLGSHRVKVKLDEHKKDGRNITKQANALGNGQVAFTSEVKLIPTVDMSTNIPAANESSGWKNSFKTEKTPNETIDSYKNKPGNNSSFTVTKSTMKLSRPAATTYSPSISVVQQKLVTEAVKPEDTLQSKEITTTESFGLLSENAIFPPEKDHEVVGINRVKNSNAMSPQDSINFSGITDPPKSTRHHVDALSDIFNALRKNRLGKFEIAYVILGLYVFVVSLIFLVFLCKNPREPRSRQLEELNKSRETTRCFTFTVVGLLSLFLCLYVGIEVAVGEVLQTFASKESLRLSTASGYFLSYLFWGSFAISRFFMIIISMKFSGFCILLTNLTICLVASIMLVAGADKIEALLWLGTVILGLGVGPLFPTAIAWMERYVHVTNKTASVFILGAAVGEIVIPIIINTFINQEPMVLMYMNIVVNALCFVSFVVLSILAFRHGEKYLKKPKRSLYQLANVDDTEDATELITNSFSNSNGAEAGIKQRYRKVCT